MGIDFNLYPIAGAVIGHEHDDLPLMKPGDLVCVEDDDGTMIWFACPCCGMGAAIKAENAVYDNDGPSLRPRGKKFFGPMACCATRWTLDRGTWKVETHRGVPVTPSEADLKAAAEYRHWMRDVKASFRQRLTEKADQ